MQTETIKPEVEVDRDDSHALIAVEKINALEVFNGGMLPIIEEIHKKVAVLVPDVTTAKGRKEIASMANKIARSKTLLDDVGKNLVADWKAKAKIVDDNRKLMRDKLDALKEATRAPLTKWEEAEQARLEKFQNGLNDLIAFQTIHHGADVQMIEDIIQEIKAIEVTDEWGDFKERAVAAQSYAMKNAVARLEERKAYEEQQAELAKLRALEAERQAKAAEEKRNQEIAERARIEAEQKAKAALAKAEADAAAAIQRAKEAEARAKQAEENAKREAEYKAKKEAERIAADKAKAEAEAKRKEELKKRRDIHKQEAVDCLAEFIGKDSAQIAVDEIASGNVPHISFQT